MTPMSGGGGYGGSVNAGLDSSYVSSNKTRFFFYKMSVQFHTFFTTTYFEPELQRNYRGDEPIK